MNQPFRLRSTDGLVLEAILDGPDDPRGGLVLCHPHPKMGGTMNAPLLIAVMQEMVRRGWAVLRFNFRGIGSSEGEHGLGIDEVADATGAVERLRDRFGTPVAIAGWSFGGSVAVRTAAAGIGVVGIAGIAPAVKGKPGITAGLPDPDQLKLSVPLLVVCGANDELVDPVEARTWTEAVGGRFVEMKGANHFFWAKYDALAGVVADFFEEFS